MEGMQARAKSSIVFVRPPCAAVPDFGFRARGARGNAQLLCLGRSGIGGTLGFSLNRESGFCQVVANLGS